VPNHPHSEFASSRGMRSYSCILSILHNKYIQSIIVTFLAIVLSLLNSVYLYAEQNNDKVGNVPLVRGTASIKASDGTTEKILDKNQKIAVWDSITTGANTRVILSLLNNIRLLIGSNTKITLRDRNVFHLDYMVLLI
jgi:hypothetical protein